MTRFLIESGADVDALEYRNPRETHFKEIDLVYGSQAFSHPFACLVPSLDALADWFLVSLGICSGSRLICKRLTKILRGEESVTRYS